MEESRERDIHIRERAFAESVLPRRGVQLLGARPLHDDDQLERMAAKSAVKRS